MAGKSTSSSIFDFISKLNTVTIERLYGKGSEGNQGSWASKAVFQSLSKLGKNYVMRLIFVTSPVDPDELLGWVYSDCRDIHYATIQELKNFRILQDVPNDFGGSKALLIMNKYFQKGMQFAITSPIEPWSDTAAFQALKVDKNKPTIEYLETNSVSQWNEVLLTLLEMPIPKRTDISDSDRAMKLATINNFLIASNLMIKLPGSDKYQITADGYEYVLKDHQGQVWAYILECLNNLPSHDEALSLLFMLSDCTLGEGYPIDALTERQQQLVFEFSHFGITYIRSVKSSRFYPCNVAINLILHTEKVFVTQETIVQARALTAGTMRSINMSTVDLKIIVQTNCDVVAYISNDLHFAMLNIFIDIKMRFPNMAMGKITREKIRDAYRRGIRVSQILDFLTLHAHPVTANREHVVPLNIKDQLALWYAEQYRIRDAEAVIVCCNDIIGMNETTYTTLYNYAKERLECVLWADPTTLTFAVTPEGFVQLDSYAQDELAL